MTNPRGTWFETEIVNDLSEKFDNLEIPAVATRRPKAGQKHEADVELRLGAGRPIGVLAWHRIVKKDGKKVRVPDGERRVAVLSWDDFVALLGHAHNGGYWPTVYFQCKATQAANVTRILGGLNDWIDQHVR